MSTILIGLSVSFVEKFDSNISIIVLILSWCSLFIAIFFGIFALMAIVGNIAKPNELLIDVYDKSIKNSTILQILFFLLGILFLLIYSSGIKIKNEDKNEKQKQINYYNSISFDKKDDFKLNKNRNKEVNPCKCN
ncbi:hypothetical protein [Chryseobacterium gambrini]|uniref:hypothetical protein n=1 Tax=Chryseobacterium gambrini TaxID=373672 RepID=UPI003BA70882